KSKESECGEKFEEGNLFAFGSGFAFADQFQQQLRGDLFSADDKPFLKANQMRRGILVHAQTRRFENRLQESQRRALAIGAGDVESERQVEVRVAEFLQERILPLEACGKKRRVSCVDVAHSFFDGGLRRKGPVG